MPIKSSSREKFNPIICIYSNSGINLFICFRHHAISLAVFLQNMLGAFSFLKERGCVILSETSKSLRSWSLTENQWIASEIQKNDLLSGS